MLQNEKQLNVGTGLAKVEQKRRLLSLVGQAFDSKVVLQIINKQINSIKTKVAILFVDMLVC